MVKIEVLFPEICNLYGDPFNIRYLRKCIADCSCTETHLSDIPEFVSENVDLVYLSPMTEKAQEIVIGKLLPFRERLKELIAAGKIFLFTGNAFEVLENYIEKEDGSRIEGLGILDAHAKRDMMHRFNSLFLGELDGIRILGFKSQFSQSYGDNSECFAFRSVRGCGINPESQLEGFRVNNLFATYLLGPILIVNPLFTKYLLRLLGQSDKLAFETEIMRAYEARKQDFESSATEFVEKDD